MELTQEERSRKMTDFAWLIEGPGRNYLGARLLGKYEFFWTNEYDRALRFYSKEQADVAMMAIREMDRNLFPGTFGDPKPVEHGWIRLTAQPSAGEAERVNVLEKALREISGGCFDGASTMAINGQWQEMFNTLQRIARAALTPGAGT